MCTWEARCQSGVEEERRVSQLSSKAGDSVEIPGPQSLTEAAEKAFRNELAVLFGKERMVLSFITVKSYH